MHTHPGRIDAYSVDFSICCIQCRWASKYLDFGKSSRKLTHLRLSTSSGPLENLDAATPSTTRAKKNYSFHIFPHDIPIISFFLSFSTWFTYNVKFFLSFSTWFTYNLNLFWWFVRIFFRKLKLLGGFGRRFLRQSPQVDSISGEIARSWDPSAKDVPRTSADMEHNPRIWVEMDLYFFFVKVGHIYDYIYIYICILFICNIYI